MKSNRLTRQNMSNSTAGIATNGKVPAKHSTNKVVTAKEAADLFNVPVNTIRSDIDRGNIIARKSGGTWLMDKLEAAQRYASKGAVRGTICLLIPTIATALLAIAAY